MKYHREYRTPRHAVQDTRTDAGGNREEPSPHAWGILSYHCTLPGTGKAASSGKNSYGQTWHLKTHCPTESPNLGQSPKPPGLWSQADRPARFRHQFLRKLKRSRTLRCRGQAKRFLAQERFLYSWWGQADRTAKLSFIKHLAQFYAEGRKFLPPSPPVRNLESHANRSTQSFSLVFALFLPSVWILGNRTVFPKV